MKEKQILGRPKIYKGNARTICMYISDENQDMLKRFAKDLGMSISMTMSVLIEFCNTNNDNVLAYYVDGKMRGKS